MLRRYLVVANQPLSSDQLRQELLLRAESEDSLFHVLVPDTPEREYAFDWATTTTYPPGSEGARQRLKEVLLLVRGAGASALGALADPNPIEAVQRQVKLSAYDEVIVSMLPERSSRWFRMDIPTRIARAITTPVTTITAKAA